MRLAFGGSDSRLPDEERVEIVERKGLGHPDSICDALAEELSLALSRFYETRFGRILHHNVDKALLVAGRSEPRFGGGRVVEPIQVFLAGRATLEHAGVRVPIEALAEETTRSWLARHLHALDAERHVEVTSLVRPGASELVDLYDASPQARLPLANDTSCGVGYAPLSELERMVLAVERRLSSVDARRLEPAIGEDVKVMGVREGDSIELTVACAMVDRELPDLAAYGKATRAVREIALETARPLTSRRVGARVNAADDLAAGRVYLTVTGTSAESGDDGQPGRGNRANGLITPGRPMTIESVAGKNPVSHVGKLYNLVADAIAARLVETVRDVRGAECRLVSRIGHPIDEPQLVDVRLVGRDAEGDPELRAEVERLARDELARLPDLARALVAGEIELPRARTPD